MEYKSNTIFVDTGMFKALLDLQDEHHEEGKRIWKKLHEEHVSLVTSNFIIDETLTLLRTKCGLQFAINFRELLVTNAQYLNLIRVLADDENSAWEWFLYDWEKLSFTDCVSFAIMKRLNLLRVATFDSDFEKAGFIVEK